MSRVFLAGATGAVGRPLVAMLIESGHDVVAMTRSAERARELEASGAQAVIADVFDREDLIDAVGASRPDVVLNQLTDLPEEGLGPRGLAEALAPNDRIRREGAANLLEAARVGGARRIVVQSVAFFYAPQGGWVKDEQAPLWHEAPEPFASTVATVSELEQSALEATGIEAVILRYGAFYGPGTWYSSTGAIGRQVAAGKLPVIGRGEARTSFIHVDDAARACRAFVDGGSPGIYNVVDDEPAPQREWLPALAEALDARGPRRVPRLVARIAAGRPLTEWLSTQRGASNARLRSEIEWQPRFLTWRKGFNEGLG